MRNLLILFLFLNFSSLIFAQTARRTVKVSALEIVDLKVVEATFTLDISPDREQLREYMDEDYGYDDYYDEGSYYEDVEVGGMSDEEYREKRRLLEEKREKEKEEKRAKFVPYSPEDLMALLKKNKLSFTSRMVLSPYRNEYEDSKNMMTLVFLTIKNSSEYEKMLQILLDKPVRFTLTSVNFESSEEYTEAMIPLLTEKAKKEADLLAKSLGKSLGDILECRNDLETDQIRSHHYGTMRDGYSRELDTDPFFKTQPQKIEYHYVFELLEK